MVILSFKFDRKNTRARSLFDLYHSLCRQILVSRPQTLYHVFPYAGRRGEYSEFEDESISVLFHSMLNSLIDHEISIFCLICDLNQCLDPIAEAIGRLKAVASTKEGQFKLLLTAEETTELTGDSGQQIQHVAIQPGSHRISNIIRLDSLSTLSLLKQENSAWCGLENSLIDYMKFLPQNDPFLVAELNMILLRCTTQGCTRKELEKKLQGNPKDLTECYKQLLLSISEPHRSSTLTLLKWMSAAVRPLSQHELAVTVAVNSPSWNGADTEKMIFLDVFEILQDCMAPLIRFQDTYAYFIHDSFRQYLVEHGTQYSATVSSYSPEAGEEAMEQDDDCWIIRHCFNYLRRVGQHVMGVVESGDRQRISLLQDEHGLLRYTTLNWPQHFRQSRCRETTKTQILGFFQNKEQLDTWAACFKCVQTSVTGKACEVTDIDTLLKIVCYYGLDEILESCIESSKDDGNFDSQKSYCLDLAAKRGHHGIVQALLDEGAYSDKAFGLAVTGEHHDVCELLLESNPDSINQPGLHRQVPLYWATHIGSNSMVSFLLARHANPNFPFAARHGPDMETLDIPSNPSYHQDRADNETPIHLAALTGQKEILQILLGGGADVYQRSPVGYDALLYAAWGGSHEIVSFLLSQGADGGAKSEPTQNTALHLAAEHGHYRIVEILILHLKDRPELLSIPDKMGLAPIHLAAREGHLKVLVLLLDALESNGNTTKASETQDRDESLTSSFDEDYFERWRLARRRMRHRWRRIAQSSYGSSGAKTAVEWAAENGQNEVLLTLLAKKTTVPGVHVTEARRDEDGYTVLHLAAKKGFPYVVKRLQEDTKYAALLPVNDKSERDGMTPLHLAAREGHADVVTILLQHGGNPDVTNEWEQTALHIAAKHGHLLCLDELLQKSDVLSVDMFHRTALHLAAGNGHFGVVAKLHKDSDIWAESKDGYTVLDLVTEKCSFDQVKSFVKILEDGSDGDVFTTKGLPLHAAARRNDIEILQFLQQKGWDHEATSSLGRSPLHDAVSYKSLDAVDMLLAQFKCNVDAVDDSREAPIHCAKDTNILKRLLESEAKYDEKNGLGQTPLFLAAYGQLPDIVDILLGLNPEPDVNVPDSDGWSPLHAAYDSPRITRSLIKHHAKTDVLTSEGRTPLAMAVRWDVMETVEILLDAGASPDHAGSSDQRPLALAYTSVQSESRLHITKLLIDHGADPRLRFEADVTILDVAAKEGDQAAVKYILKKLVERPLPDDELREMCTSAIKRHVASRYNFNRELAEMLNTQGYFAVTKCHPDALTAACENGSIEAVEWLLEQIEALQENKGCYGRALHAAVKSDYEAEEKVSRLLEHSDHIDINDGGYDQPTALQQAAYHGDGALLNLLLEKGADACLAKGDLDTVLNCAIANPEIDGSIIKTILTNAGNAQTAGLKGRYPIHQAAIHDRADVIEILGTGGLDAYVMDEEGLSPLMYGLIGKNNSVVNRLLSTECGFRLEDADSNGLTPLMTATILSDASSVQSLLEKGFGNDAQDYQGNTALSFACDNDRPELVSILLAHKADPTVVDCRGNGPLYWATRMAGRGMMEDIMSNMDFLDDSSIQHLNVAIHGAVASNKREALELLLSSNANVDPNYARCDGWTPLYTAFRYGFDHIQSLLEDVLGTSYMSGTVALEMPTRWHPEDKHPGIAIDDDNTSALKSVGT
ncbi:hypothetical protein NW752_006746 [Fusarium irregulare]|nr:hypothetical protein NW752_006746 [Fusarium irregulare]